MVSALRCRPGAPGLLALLLLLPLPGARGNCGAPPRLSFAELQDEFKTQTDFPVGTTVRYSCRSGFQKVPGESPTLVCENESLWSKPKEFCRRKSCGRPGNVVNGKVHIDTDLLFGSKVTFSCEEGFRLVGQKTSHCVIDGTRVTWNHELPFCEEIPCLPPPDIDNGRYFGDPNNHYTYGSTVTYSCNTVPGGTRSFSLIGEASIHCTSDEEQNGVWSGEPPECKVGCQKPDVQNGNLLKALDEKIWYSVNETIPFKCSPGYQFSSHSHLPATDRFSITCLADGSWTALPKCTKQSTSDVCEMVRENREFTECGVPLEKLKTLLEVQKLHLEIEKLKQELKSQ